MKTAPLAPRELDFLKEVANIGAGRAATALSQMIHRVVSLRVPEVRALELRDVPDAVGGAESPVAGIHLRVLGEVRGNLLLVLPPPSAIELLISMGTPTPNLRSLDPLAASALREVGNILVATYLTAVSKILERSLVPSVPGLAVDMAGAVVDLLLMDLGGVTDRALVLETCFHETNGPIRGQFFLLPDPASLPTLLDRLRRAG